MPRFCLIALEIVQCLERLRCKPPHTQLKIKAKGTTSKDKIKVKHT